MLLKSYIRSEAGFRALFGLMVFVLFIFSSSPSFATPSIQEVVRFTLMTRGAWQSLDVGSLASQEESFSALELRRLPEDLTKMKSLGFEMMEQYLKAGHLQEALWILRRADLNSEAQYLEDQIKRTLLTGKPVRESEVDRGGNASWWVFDNGIQGLAKPAELDWERSIEYEVFAYELDKFLGLNRVPVTVAATGPDGKPYSLQLRIMGAAISRISFRDENYLSKVEEAGEVYLFDHLTGQTDRHNFNSLHTRTGRLVLIDNGRAMGQHLHQRRMTPPPSEYVLSGIALSGRLMARIRNVQIEELYQHFGKILSVGEIREVFLRIEELRTYYPNTEFIEPETESATSAAAPNFRSICRKLLNF